MNEHRLPKETMGIKLKEDISYNTYNQMNGSAKEIFGKENDIIGRSDREENVRGWR